VIFWPFRREESYEDRRDRRITIARIAAIFAFVIGLSGAIRNYIAVQDHEVWRDNQGNVASVSEMYLWCLVSLGVSVFGLALFVLLLRRPPK
jgi:hypothetical protein